MASRWLMYQTIIQENSHWPRKGSNSQTYNQHYSIVQYMGISPSQDAEDICSFCEFVRLSTNNYSKKKSAKNWITLFKSVERNTTKSWRCWLGLQISQIWLSISRMCCGIGPILHIPQHTFRCLVESMPKWVWDVLVVWRGHTQY